MSLLKSALERAEQKIKATPTAPAEGPEIDAVQVAIDEYDKATTPAAKLKAMKAYLRLTQD